MEQQEAPQAADSQAAQGSASGRPKVDRDKLRRDLHEFRMDVHRQLRVFDHVPPEALSFVVR